MFKSGATKYGAAIILRSLVFAVAFAMLSGIGLTASKAQTIDELRSRNKIVIGVGGEFPPFGFLDEKQELVGYNIDFARLVAKALEVELELIIVKSVNRIPYLVTKKVDMLVASLGITPARAREVMFTIPIAADQSFVVAPTDSKIDKLSDLVGKQVAVGRGSSNDIFFTEVAPEGVNIMRYSGEPAAAQALLSGQVDALVMSNTMLNDLLKRPGASEKLDPKVPLKVQFDAMTLRKDAFELHQWLNTFVYYLKLNGELDALYRKWLYTPLPELPVF